MRREIEYITELAALEIALRSIEEENQIGLDLEFDKNRFGYGFTLSLVQIATSKGVFLIDAIELTDLQILFDYLERKDVEKVVFAFGEDIRLLHYLGCRPQNVYDLDLLSKIQSYEPCSLSNALHLHLGIAPSQSSQKSNWLKRPLSEKQKVYGAEDVIHLAALKNRLVETCENEELLAFVEEENKRYVLNDYSEVPNFSPLKNKDLQGLSEVDYEVLKSIIDFREELAKSLNKPGYMLAPKELLIGLSSGTVKVPEIFNFKGVSTKFKKQKAEIHKILVKSRKEAIESGKTHELPAIPKLSKEEYEKYREEKKKREEFIKTVLTPIKEELKKEYGEHASAFMLSNKIQQEIIQKGLNSTLSYKQELIRKISHQKGLSIELIE